MKAIKCNAAVAYGYNQPLKIVEVTVAPPQAHEVRIKMVATALCHSDAHFVWRPMLPAEAYPYVLGHEGSGVVESVGDEVESLKPGDKVIPCFLCQCGKCEACLDPRSNFCELFPEDLGFFGQYVKGNPSRITLPDGKVARQFLGCGTFSEYTVVSDIQVTKVPDDAPLDVVCITGCGFPTGFGASSKVANVTKGSTCAVFGLGTIGLSAVMGCKANGAKSIIGINHNHPLKKAKGLELGCTEFLSPQDYDKPIEDVIKEKTGGRGVDFAIEAIGSAECMLSALKMCKRGTGRAVIVGLPDKELSLNGFELLSGKTLTGCYFGGYKSRDGIKSLVDRYMAGEIKLEALITHKFKFRDINKAFDAMKEGKR